MSFATLQKEQPFISPQMLLFTRYVLRNFTDSYPFGGGPEETVRTRRSIESVLPDRDGRWVNRGRLIFIVARWVQGEV